MIVPNPTRAGKSTIARNLASLAERNLTNLAMQAIHECRTATSEAEREQIALAGLAITHARNAVLRHLMGAGK